MPPSALTSHATAYDPHSDAPSLLEDFPRAGRGHGHSSHQRTLTGTLLNNSQSFLTRATSTIQQHTSGASIRAHSPSKSLASFLPSRTAIDSTKSWFNGSSAPVRLGIPRQDDEDDYDDDAASESGSEVPSEYYSSDSEPESEDGEEVVEGDEGPIRHTMNMFNRKPAQAQSASASA